MTNGWLMLGLGTLICIGVFLNGLRFSRMSDERIARLNMPFRNVRATGRYFMIFAPLFWLLWTAMCFGLLGPVGGMQTIRLHG